jgi:hypothetical protein
VRFVCEVICSNIQDEISKLLMCRTVPNLSKVQRRVQIRQRQHFKKPERPHSTHPFLLLGTNHFDVQTLNYTKTEDCIHDDILTSTHKNTHANPRLPSP